MRLGRALRSTSCVALAAWLVARAAAARPFDPAGQAWDGCAALVALAKTELGAGRVRVVDEIDWSALGADDGLLVLHPDHAPSSEDLLAFLRAGGRVGLLDDYGAGDRTLAEFGIERVPAPAHPRTTLRGNPSLPIAEPTGDASGALHPIVAQVPQLVTNHPTALAHPRLVPVLSVRADGEPDAVLAIAGVVGEGRLFAMGDPSAVTNQMLRYPGNRTFAAALARYLVDDETTGRKGGTLYFVTERFRERGTFGGAGGLAALAAAKLEALATLLRDVDHDGLPGPFAFAVGAIAAMGAIAWSAQAATRRYAARLPRFARPNPLVAQGGAAGRAAVLAAPTTDPALALLELKRALEEVVAESLGLPARSGAATLLEAARRSGRLDAADVGELKEMLREMAIVETAVAAGRRGVVSERQVLAFGDRAKRVQERLRAARRTEARA